MKFQITRISPVPYASRAVGFACLRGAPLGAHASDPDAAAVAAGTNFIGFAIKAVTATGPVLQDHVFPQGHVELDAKIGDQVSIEQADEVEVAGDEYLVESGVNALTANTAIGAAVSFDAGRFAAAGESDQVYFRVSAHLGNDDDGDHTIRLQRQ